MLTLPSDQPSSYVMRIQHTKVKLEGGDLWDFNFINSFTALVQKFGHWTFELNFGLRSSDFKLVNSLTLFPKTLRIYLSTCVYSHSISYNNL